MNYDQARESEQKAMLDAAIAHFVARYQANTANPRLPTRKTVILFPGGMGSRLMRARAACNPGTVSYQYDVAWLDCSVVMGAVNDLKMNIANGHDSSDRFVVADGPVDFSMFGVGLTPYAGFIDWCDAKGIDWFIFGWDWRRAPEAAVDLFLNWFPCELRRQVQLADKTADPLADFSIIGHSFGGMVVKLIVNEYAHPHVVNLKKAITVGSPFYGHGGHVHRYFVGDPDLPMYRKSHVVEAVSSMPGGYALLYMDLGTYNTVRQALAADPRFKLLKYPVTDADDGSNVDPYHPHAKGKRYRYPANFGFSPGALADGLTTYKKIAKGLDLSIQARFHNFRGVLARGSVPANSTVCDQTWACIPASYDPDAIVLPATIADVTQCPGDGVIPAWSARHVSTPDANIKDFVGDFKHMDLMNYAEIHNALENLLGLPMVQPMIIGEPKKPRRRRSRRTMRIASDTKMQEYRGRFEAISAMKLSPSEREQEIRRVLAGFSLRELRALLARAYENALKSPGQKIGALQEKRSPAKGHKSPVKKPKRPAKKRRTST